MPCGPKGERRPADVIGNAVKVMRIAECVSLEDLLWIESVQLTAARWMPKDLA